MDQGLEGPRITLGGFSRGRWGTTPASGNCLRAPQRTDDLLWTDKVMFEVQEGRAFGSDLPI